MIRQSTGSRAMLTVWVALTIVALSSCASENSANDQSVLEVMVLRVAPATDILWGADNPQTEADWRMLDDAATETATAFRLTKSGGSGPNDNSWATNADWQKFSDQMIGAAELAKSAIAARDIDALLDAGGPLYEPCEACHAVYHPGVAQQ